MTEDEIRATAKKRCGLDLRDALENENRGTEFFMALVLLEIAAQLAELNTNLAKQNNAAQQAMEYAQAQAVKITQSIGE